MNQPGTRGPGGSASLLLSPATLSIQVGQSRSINATLQLPGGGIGIPSGLTWSAGDASVARVDAAGGVTGLQAGSTTITVVASGDTARATVTVVQASVASLVIDPTTLNLNVGGTQTLRALPYDERNVLLEGRAKTWRSSNPNVATVGIDGRVTAIGMGTATITAECEGRAAQSIVNVTAPTANVASITPTSATIYVGQNQTFTAQMRDASGAPVAATFVWSSSDPNIATTTAQAGIINGRSAGTVTILATADGRTAAASLTVRLVPVRSVSVAPADVRLTVAQSAQLTATPRDSAGNTLTGRPITWASSSDGVATVDGTGRVTARAEGVAVISGTSGDATGTTTVTVTRPVATVTGISITPASPTLFPGDTLRFAATARLSDNTTQAITPAWTAEGGAITTAGLFTAGTAAGTFAVRATHVVGTSTFSAQASVTVQARVVPGALCANQPAGLTTGFSTAWNAVPVNGGFSSEGWWHNQLGSARVENLSITQDAAAPRSPSNLLQMRFPQGSPGGDAPMWFGTDLPTNSGTVYMCLNMKVDPSWTNGGNAGTKFAFIRTPYREGAQKQNHYWAFQTGDFSAGEMRPMFGTQFGTPGPERAYFANNGESVHGGQWRQVELLWIAESPAGSQNGVGRIWLDGRQVVNVTNATFFFPGQQTMWTAFEVVPTYGGGTNPVPRTMYWWIDHVHVGVK